MMNFLKKIIGRSNPVNWKELVQRGAIIIDVRSAGEFNSGHIKGAINVPLPNLGSQAGMIRKMNKPVITCCLSGARSGSAKRFLEQQGIEVYNGGNWSSLQSRISK